MELKNLPTRDLVAELVKRVGVSELINEQDKNYCIMVGIDPDGEHQDDTITGSGSVQILLINEEEFEIF